MNKIKNNYLALFMLSFVSQYFDGRELKYFITLLAVILSCIDDGSFLFFPLLLLSYRQ